MVRVVDWQQIVALVIVGVTAGLFLWNRLRPRKFSFERDTHCGCAGAGDAGAKQSIVYRQKKGERPEIVVKMK
ncbi:MAG: hypothetical protein AB1705_01625 [Verrucomicrobiota bacterium]